MLCPPEVLASQRCSPAFSTSCCRRAAPAAARSSMVTAAIASPAGRRCSSSPRPIAPAAARPSNTTWALPPNAAPASPSRRSYDTARAALAYGGPARATLLAFKHGDRDYLARIMAPHMARAAGDLLGPETLVIPVPLHRWRLWRRGFNQAALLAEQLCRTSGATLSVDALERAKATPMSTGLGRKARAANVRGAFRVRRRALVQGRAHRSGRRCADHRRHGRGLRPRSAPRRRRCRCMS